MIFAYRFMFTFIACTIFIAFHPSATTLPWFTNIFGSRNSDSSYRFHFSSLFSYFLPNSSQPIYGSTQAIVLPPLPQTDLKGFIVTIAKQFQTVKNMSKIVTLTSVKSPPLYKNNSSKNRTETSNDKAKSQAPPLKLQPVNPPFKNDSSIWEMVSPIQNGFLRFSLNSLSHYHAISWQQQLLPLENSISKWVSIDANPTKTKIHRKAPEFSQFRYIYVLNPLSSQ
ncbi:hypothetical protein NE237_018660 [Protea cynaroides]|uniref:Uncharacterized protein n=1 Tax=Protea cynaroides TaxID=273540 RepID=A0A9Q0KAI3_9MAGN|nr:hypothetical protein NE237_018660 [Protea cynaroides]